MGFLFFRFGWTPASKPTGLCSSIPVFFAVLGEGGWERREGDGDEDLTVYGGCGGDGGGGDGDGLRVMGWLSARFIFPLRRHFFDFPLRRHFFDFPHMKCWVFFCYLLRFLYPLGVPNGAVLFEYLVHGFECLIRKFLFWRFFCFFGSVFGSRICIGFCFQRLQYEGSNRFSQI